MPDAQPPVSATKAPFPTGAIFLGVLLTLIGIGFSLMLWKAYTRAMETRAWVEVPARITAAWMDEQPFSPISDRSPSYKVEIRYDYEFGGEKRVGTQVKRVDGRTRKKDQAEETLADYPVGKALPCYVNPEDPDFAILRHNTKAPLYTIWFPGLFAIAGIGLIISALRRRGRSLP